MNNAHTEYYKTEYASVVAIGATDYSTKKTFIAGKGGKQIVLCDIIGSKIGDGGEFRFFDGDTEFFRMYPNAQGANTHSLHFVAPIKLSPGNEMGLQLDDDDINWSVLVTYYYL